MFSTEYQEGAERHLRSLYKGFKQNGLNSIHVPERLRHLVKRLKRQGLK